jgi:beta-glucosidase
MPDYRDPSLPVSARADDLLARMTLDEKLAQLAGVWGGALLADGVFDPDRARRYLADGIGHVSRVASSGTMRPREVAAAVNAIQRFLVEETRLGIPAVVHEESTAGFCARDATCFPQAIGLASTWDPALLEEVGAVIREQMRAVGARHTLAPVLDVARDPRWGRTEETYGEDAYLASRLGVAYVRGVQTRDLATGVVATGKHFVTYGAGEGGLNWAPSHLSPREILERYLPPFEAAIREAGLASVMNSYNEIDGTPCGASRELLTDWLRGRMGFDGVVVADYFTIPMLATYHCIAADAADAAARALEAGIDVELPARDCYGAPLREALADGRADPAWVDRSVRRVLAQKLALGLFENPRVDAAAAPSHFQTPAQRALARRVACASIVLLKNDGGLLPLDPALRRLAVVGPHAESVRLLQGDYHYPSHLEYQLGGSVDLSACFPPTVTLAEGIRRRVSAATVVTTAPGCDVTGGATDGFVDAVAAARAADVAVVCVGDRAGLADGCTSGEFTDRADLGLPGVQQALVEAIVATGTPTVVVLLNGRPPALPWIAAHAPAVVEAWLPGEEGGNALADVLFGDASPAGRLPATLPRAVGQVPLYYNHKPSGARSQMKGDYADLSVTPLFPFGHGLSYTRFEYANLTVPATVDAAGAVDATLDVTNAGARGGDEVVQLYVRDVVASVTRPVLQLAGFARVALQPGETVRVAFRLDLGQLAFYDRAMELVVEPGEVEVLVGASSADLRLRASVEVTGARRVLTTAEVRPTAVSVERLER